LLPHPFDRLALVAQGYDDRNTVGQEWLPIVLMIQSEFDKSKIRLIDHNASICVDNIIQIW